MKVSSNTVIQEAPRPEEPRFMHHGETLDRIYVGTIDAMLEINGNERGTYPHLCSPERSRDY